jgi:hypothetical protein
MKKHHQVTDLHFDGDLMILTIDGQKKTFQVSEISPALENASEQEKTYLKSLLRATVSTGRY